MAKTKRKHLAAIAAMKESQPVQHVEGDCFSETSPLDDNEPWIEVRKQKVIIVIPPLPKPLEGPKKVKKSWKAKMSKAAIHDCIGKDFVTKPSRRADQRRVNKISSKANKLGGTRRDKVSNAHFSLDKVPNDTSKVLGNGAEQNAAILKSRLESVPTVDARQIRSRRKWKDGKNALNTSSRRRKPVGHLKRENYHVIAPPLSGMDALLASVETINSKQTMPLNVALQGGGGELQRVANISDTGQEALHQQTQSPEILIASTQENISLDTADSGIQPHASSALQVDMKVSLHEDKASEKCASEHMPECFEMPRKEENVVTSERLFMNKNREKEIVVVDIPKLCNDMREKVPTSDLRHWEVEFLDDQSHVYPVLSANQSFKVLTLKKQLEKAGGLSKWLFSVGLERFVEVFEKRMFNELELLLLNMDDVKKMGIAAVGPRRKLIWAINHLSQQVM